MRDQSGRRRVTSLLFLLMAGMLVLASCGSDDGSNGDDAEPTQEPESQAAGSGGDGSESGPRGILIDEPQSAPDFELTDHEGNSFRLSDHRGKVVSIFFGYTSCPDICPLTLMHMQDAAEQLGDQADDALFLFVSVDPERDTPEQLAKYVGRVDTEVIGLTGEQEELEEVWENYDITVEIEPRENDDSYLVNHSAQIWVLDQEGQAVMVLPPQADGDDMAHDLQWLLERTS